ncbi:MAG: protoheme IX farnesyltransferase [Gemmatimonadales bacterium]|jgi:protoheme IX farnesyltransferase|nr:MAG: protoheme IX farnesyltransferase [Gemmatimonadales bacterium]
MNESPDGPGVATSRREPPKGLFAAYYELTKPGIAGFVAITAAVSYFVAARGRPDLFPVLSTLLGTGLATGGALALNQYVEREVDGRMKRTRSRPIPSGRLAPSQALTFGLLLLLLGIAALGLIVGPLPAAITAVSAGAYIGVYTPLKTRSYLATLAGAVPGALPGLIGWSAATGGLELGGWVLFGIFFLWQLPHVLALAWLLREDYQRVGFFLAPPTDPEGRRIGKHMVYHSVSLILLSVAPTVVGLTGPVYMSGAAILSLGMLGLSALAAHEMSIKRVRQVFIGSILYQPLLLLLFLLDTIPPAP